MAAVNAALNRAADGIAGDVDFLSLHEGNPDASSGTTLELTGGSYARKAPAYGAAASGTAALTGNVVFDGPGTSTEVQYLGFWGGTGGDTYLGSAQLSAFKTIGDGDTLTITAAPITVSAA